MKHIIITGSTGMIGRLVLEACLKREDVKTVITISRRTAGITHPKLTEVIHADFLNYAAVESHFKKVDVCFYCVGVYTGQVPAADFRKITVDYTKAFADILKRNSPGCSFCFLSGQGADTAEKSRILFAKEKGIAENYLLNLQFGKTHLFRPGYIYPDLPRKEPNAFYAMMRILYKPVAAIYPNIGVSSVQLARKMVEVGLEGGTKIIYENRDIRS